MLGKVADDLGNRRLFLPDSHINTDDILIPLIQNGIRGNGGFPGLAVADDQLPLPPANGNHRVNGFNAGLQRLRHRLPLNNAWGLVLHRTHPGSLHRPSAVNGIAQGIHYPANELLAHRHRQHLAGAAHHTALRYPGVRPKHDHADAVLL